jgi:hypothetical protein
MQPQQHRKTRLKHLYYDHMDEGFFGAIPLFDGDVLGTPVRADIRDRKFYLQKLKTPMATEPLRVVFACLSGNPISWIINRQADNNLWIKEQTKPENNTNIQLNKPWKCFPRRRNFVEQNISNLSVFEPPLIILEEYCESIKSRWNGKSKSQFKLWKGDI